MSFIEREDIYALIEGLLKRMGIYDQMKSKIVYRNQGSEPSVLRYRLEAPVVGFCALSSSRSVKTPETA